MSRVPQGGQAELGVPRTCAYSRCRKPLPEHRGPGRPSRYCLGTDCKDLAAQARRRESPREAPGESDAFQRVKASRAALEAAREGEEEARRQVAIATGVTEQAKTRLKLAQIEAAAYADLLDELCDENGGGRCP